MKKLIRPIVHTVTNIRRYQYKQVAQYAKGVHGKKILELGSGPLENGKYTYSAQHLFSNDNEFLQSDIVEKFGHRIVDVTTMDFKDEFDIVICLNVLEHVYEFEAAVANIHEALKPGGSALIAVPVMYPLHDEPGDYWRFTEHALRKIFSKYEIQNFKHNGKREFPFTYYFEAIK